MVVAWLCRIPHRGDSGKSPSLSSPINENLNPGILKSPQSQGSSSCLSSGGDFKEAGSYQYETKQSGSYTVYLPKLPSGCKTHAIGFAMGTGAPVNSYTQWYKHFASHGFAVVVDPNKAAASGKSLSNGIDQILQQNTDLLVQDAAGTTGHSQGGGGAFAARSNSKVTTIVGIQPGQFISSGEAKVNYLGLAGSSDMFGTLTDPKMMHYGQVSGPKFYANLQGANHISSVTGRTGHAVLYRALSTAWFRCYLSKDQAACDLFASGDCSKFGGTWKECSQQNR